MSVQTNKACLERFYDLFNTGNMAVAHELIAPDAVDHEDLPPGLTGTVAQQLEQFVALLRQAFPDLHVSVEDMIGEGDTVAARTLMTGTHQGAFFGIPATGRSIAVQGIDIVRFDGDGMIVEHWAVSDNLGMMQQLGVMPEAA